MLAVSARPHPACQHRLFAQLPELGRCYGAIADIDIAGYPGCAVARHPDASGAGVDGQAAVVIACQTGGVDLNKRLPVPARSQPGPAGRHMRSKSHMRPKQSICS